MPPSAHISNTHFWLYTVGLLLVWIIVITTATPLDQKKSLTKARVWGKNEAQEQRLEKSCQSLCEQCGCMGFYCGEECLCEFDKHSAFHRGGQKRNSTKTQPPLTNAECIASMQQDAQVQALPFEVLIQGSSGERFMRTAMQFDMDETRAAAALTAMPRKRATISIYRPYTPTQSNMLLQANESKKALKSAAIRPRRSTEHLDWFSDFATTLVRPAPLRKSEANSASASASGGNKKRETQRNEDDSTREKPESWFSDHPNRLLRPAPLFRRHQKSQKPAMEVEENETSDSQDASMAPVGEVIKNTIRNIQESDIGEGLRSGIRDGTELWQNTFQGSNLELFPKRFRNDFTEVFDTWLKNQQATEASIEVPDVPTRATQPVLLPWFRPVRFLQRVHQALN
ncbi:uncharacterized protein LOC118747401 [Rhagoletis pomonella]|uniref:uncharacterized protein LOC118747401 n=1 Tax=Rhagoletis pomonella TaxID=28610 RepID=UPI0017820F09|nr:uncharacterized protein LOC118747401 [Rhagoletis pomonella]